MMRLLVVLLSSALVLTAHAREVPIVGTDIYLQTNGPNSTLGFGDFYTHVDGGNNALGHEFEVNVSCAWPDDAPITISLFDPESQTPDPTSPTAEDELVGAADDALYDLFTPNGNQISRTFTPTGGTNGLWVELVTFEPEEAFFGCGTYTLRIRTEEDDQQSWRLRAARDPDCSVSGTSSPGTGSCSTVGAASSADIDNANRFDDADGVVGSGDEIIIGILEGSYQRTGNSCTDHFGFVNPAIQANATFHNFDMDSNGSVSYTRPDGTVETGTVSGQTAWSGGTQGNPPTRVGDTFSVTNPDDNGWWVSEICISPNNQYIWEGQLDQPQYLEQPPTPRLTLDKDDGQTTAQQGETLTYSITYDNVSDEDPVPGAAENIVITDTLPSNVSYDSCAINVPATGTCSESGGTVTYNIDGVLPAGSTGSVQLVVTVDGDTNDDVINSAQVNYTDILNNGFAPVGASDTDTIDIVADVAITKTDNEPQGGVAAGDNFAYTLMVTNNGPSAADNVTVNDSLPQGLTFVSVTPTPACSESGGTVSCNFGTLANGANETVTITVTATMDGLFNNTATVTTSTNEGDNTGNNSDDEDTTVTPVADLSLSKDVDNASPNVGQNITYTLTVFNDGPSTATNVAVSEPLPANLTFVSANPMADYNSAAGIWTVGSLNSGGNVTLMITATVDASGAITNTAEVSASDQPDPDSTPGNNDASEDDQASVPINGQEADLSVTKAVDEDAPNVGEEVTFTITVANAGPNDATNVIVGDQLPAGLTFVSANPAADYNSDTGEWTVGTVANGGSAQLTITATVDNADGQVNTAEVSSSDQFDPDSTPGNGDPNEDDQASANVVGQEIDLSLAKGVDPADLNVGEDATFTLTLVNDGPADATGVQVTDQLPAGVTYVSDSASQGDYSDGTGIWDVGDLGAGASATLMIVATIDQAGAITNTAEVTAADQPDVDSTPGNSNPDEDDQASVPVNGQQVDVFIDIAVDDSMPNVGDEITYTVTLGNDGPSTATNIFADIVLPPGLEFVSATAGQGGYNGASGEWNVGDLGAGATPVTLQIVARVTGSDDLTVVAEVTSHDQVDVDSTPGNGVLAEDDQDEVEIQVQEADLSLAKDVDDGSPAVGEDVTFTLTLLNDGPSDATNVAVTDQLPVGLTYVSDNPSQGAYMPGTGVWTVGTVPSGGSAILEIVATVDSSDDITNAAEVTASDQVDADSTPDNGDENEDDFASVPVNGEQVDVFLTQSVDNDMPEVGDTVTFTITVGNDGPDDASNLQILDELPDGLTFVSATPSVGTFDEVTETWSFADLPSGATETLVITATVDEVGEFENTAEVITHDEFDVDSTPGNQIEAEDDQQTVQLNAEQIDLEVDVAVSPDDDNAELGDDLTYTVTLINQGPSDATNVTVDVELPPGVPPSSFTPSQGTFDPNTGIWDVGDVPAGSTLTLEIVIPADEPGEYTVNAEVSAADQVDVDSTPGNDDALEDDQDGATVNLEDDGGPGPGPSVPMNVPTLHPLGLALLMLMLLAGMRRQIRGRQLS